MEDVSATEAARHFSEVLDRVERRGETFVIVRKGRRVAMLGPSAQASGRAIKDLLGRHPRDREWAAQLRQLRRQTVVEERGWNA